MLFFTRCRVLPAARVQLQLQAGQQGGEAGGGGRHGGGHWPGEEDRGRRQEVHGGHQM